MTRLRFLGTGWSHGVPVIGCDCPVCTGNHPRNQRRRPSIQVESGPVSVIIDVGPDFRDQVLTFGVHRVDAIFITHAHADHVMGLDDVRRFTWARKDPLNLHADSETLGRLEDLLPYAARNRTPGAGVPRLAFRAWEDPVGVGPLTFTPFPVPHGGMACRGVRIDSPDGAVGYVPDCNDLPREIRPHLRGLDVMILNALRDVPHPNHLTLARSRELLAEIGAKQSFLTHLGCPIDYETVSPTLSGTQELAYDGLEVVLG